MIYSSKPCQSYLTIHTTVNNPWHSVPLGVKRVLTVQEQLHATSFGKFELLHTGNPQLLFIVTNDADTPEIKIHKLASNLLRIPSIS